MREYFHTLIVTLDPELFNPPPVKNVDIGITKSFAVITFSTRGAKDILKGTKELVYKGFRLQLKKPQAFFRRMTRKDNKQEEDEENENNMIYMGCIPTFIKEEELKNILEHFGTLKHFNLVKENVNGVQVSKGYCFFEYQEGNKTDDIIKALHGLAIADKRLKVNRA